VNDSRNIRELIYTNEFKEYYHSLDERTKDKYGDCLTLLEEIRVLSTKFVKALVNTNENLYELRVSVGSNEHRSILFSADHDNIIQATKIVILNGFLKKSSKDYNKQIKTAISILNNLKL
jgi:hypothetical protein